MELSDPERRVLLELARSGNVSPNAISGLDPREAMSAASWLERKGLVEIAQTVDLAYVIGEEGRRLLENGLPERRLLESIDGSVPIDALREASGMDRGEFSIGLGWLRRKGLVAIEGGRISLTPAGEASRRSADPEIVVLARLAAEPGGIDADALSDVERRTVELLRRRGEAVAPRERSVRILRLTDQGRAVPRADLELRAGETQLTADLLRSGGWRKVSFRPYDVGMLAPALHGGRTHPLTAITEKVRRIFLGMGFAEIEGTFDESSFWCMDALFIPQDHPARDLQDTFYLSGPPADLSGEPVDVISSVHEDGGGTGSTGWRYEWSREIAERRLLRTHTTVNTIRHLYEHPEPPVRVFSIDRVFRREAIDSTHLPEFQQIEGVAMEEGASFSQLIGLLTEFYGRMGFDNVRVRPGYFPYTEPSLEVEVLFHGRWLELGGAGMFRPEVTEPLGVRHPVLAWGLGLERLAMLSLEITDIRDLYMSDLAWLQGSPCVEMRRPE